MFGSKNKAYLEELQNLKEKLQSAERVVSGTAEGKGIYEANVSDIAESRNQMQADVKQIGENLSVISDLAGQNVEAIQEYLQKKFGAAEYQAALQGRGSRMKISAIYTPKINCYRDVESIQFEIQEIQ